MLSKKILQQKTVELIDECVAFMSQLKLGHSWTAWGYYKAYSDMIRDLESILHDIAAL